MTIKKEIEKEHIQATINGLRDLIEKGVVSPSLDDAIILLCKMRYTDQTPVAWVMVEDLTDSRIISTPAYPRLEDAQERTVTDLAPVYLHPYGADCGPSEDHMNTLIQMVMMAKKEVAEGKGISPEGVLEKLRIDRLERYKAMDELTALSQELYISEDK